MRTLFLLDSSSLYYEPLGIIYLAGMLIKNGHTCGTHQIDNSANLIAAIKDEQADILAISTTTGRHKRFIEACNTIREYIDIPIIFGGPHPTFFPEMLSERSVDLICRGEGDYPFCELVSALQEGRAPVDIRNIDLKHEGREIRNGLRPFYEDLDSLPFPERDLIKGYKTYKKKWKSFLAGRGCPYRCSYCFNHSMIKLAEGKYVRKRSVDNLIEEVLEVKEKYSIKMVDFLDDTFILDEKWLEAFSERFPREVELPFGCNVRANLVNERICQLLRKAGCIEVAMGVESGNDRLRNELLERGLSKEQIIDSAKQIRQAGIRLITQNMIALPEETLECALETVELNLQCRLNLSGFSFYQPYPGTELCDYATREGLFDRNVDEVSFSCSEDFEIRMDENLRSGFHRIVELYPLMYTFPIFLPLFKFSTSEGRGKRLKRVVYIAIVTINFIRRMVFFPFKCSYLIWIFLKKERTRYHYYKWFSRNISSLWNRYLRVV